MGARVAKFLTRHNGKRTSPVTPSSAFDLVVMMPMVASKLLKVSARIIEYDKFPAKQSRAEEAAIIQDVFVPRVLSHASA